MEQLFWQPVILSIQTAVTAGIIVILLGMLVGRIMARREFRGKIMIETLLLSPIVLPPTVIGFLLILVFGKNSPVGRWLEAVFQQSVMFTWWAAVIAAIVVSFPLMYQSAKTGFSTQNQAVEEAARDLGANEWQVFWRITLPLACRSLISGAILSFVRALGEFGATLMFAGNIPGKTQTVPTAIYMAIDAGNMELAWAWVVTTIILSTTFLALSQRVNTRISS